MGTDDSRVEAVIKRQLSDFDRSDRLTFYVFIGGFLIWLLNYPAGLSVWSVVWATVVPVGLVAFAASRRWSGLLSVGPSAPVDE